MYGPSAVVIYVIGTVALAPSTAGYIIILLTSCEILQDAAVDKNASTISTTLL